MRVLLTGLPYTMEKNYTLHKWLNREATPEETAVLKASPEYAPYLKIAEETSGFKIPEFDSKANFNGISENINTKTKVRKLYPISTFLKIAAVLAVLIAGYLYISSKDTTIATQIAEKKTFLLPDASEIVMNSNSNISYSKKNWATNRKLSLKGEAYFKVTKGEKFSVNTPQGIVQVLGTQFNVFSRNSNFYVQCFEGLVSISYNDTIVKLPAGEKLKIENGTLVLHSTTSQKAPVWVSGESSFDNVTLITVLEELERQYPIKVTSQLSNTNRRFTGSFTHNDLDLALKSICDPLKLTYSITKESVTIYDKETQ